MELLFWTSAALIAYVYAGYPLLLAAWARLAPRPPKKHQFPAGHWPSLSIILAARNESARLPVRIANLLTLPYDGPREVIVVSDGSTDGTAEAVAPFASRGDIQFVEVPAGGKPLALNAGVAKATGTILVFADARQRFTTQALSALAANFADPKVGGVTGELILDCESGSSASSIGEGVGAYWIYEKWLRRNESLVRSTLGATGAIYALRRSLWRPLRPNPARRRAGADARRAEWLAGGIRGSGDRPRSHRARRRRRNTAEAPYPRRQLSDSRPGAAVAVPDRQPGVAAVHVPQGRAPDRPLGARGTPRLQHRAGR
jgi:cellulose synthase/poly-beta-1,6-N-acetylglucosamine synthase-like glycosyltransferase